MIVKYSYDSESDVPIDFKSSYTEQDGKFVLTGDLDVKSNSEYDDLKAKKQHAFDEMHGIKEELKQSQTEASDFKSKNEILELQVKEGADPVKLQELVDTKVSVATKEDKNRIAELEAQNGEFQNTIHGGEKSKFVADIVGNFSESVKDEASYILESLFERQADNSYLTRQGFGLDAGLSAEQAVAKLTEKHGHWAKQNNPGHGNGNQNNKTNVVNPFKKDSYNVTEQHKLRAENPALADSLKAQADKE